MTGIRPEQDMKDNLDMYTSKQRSGQASVEHILTIALIAIGSLFILGLFGQQIKGGLARLGGGVGGEQKAAPSFARMKSESQRVSTMGNFDQSIHGVQPPSGTGWIGDNLVDEYGNYVRSGGLPVSDFSYAGDSGSDDSAIGGFLKGAVLGDFKEGGGTAVFLGQVVGGLNPIADARDMAANGLNVIKNPGSISSWIGLGASVIGVVPVLGDAAKIGIKRLNKAGSEAVVTIRRGSDVPYDPRAIRESLEASYPGRVTSTTTPPVNSRNNVHLAGTRHSSGIVFDRRGFPIFDDIASAEVRLSSAHVAGANYSGQMRAATRALRRMIDAGDVPASRFSVAQLRAIRGGRAQIPDLTWHHHQDVGRMQLVPRGPHAEVGHIGGFEMWYGR